MIPEKAWQTREDVTRSPLSSEVNTKNKDESVWRTIQRYIWDDPDKPAKERKFLRKLDFFLLASVPFSAPTTSMRCSRMHNVRFVESSTS